MPRKKQAQSTNTTAKKRTTKKAVRSSSTKKSKSTKSTTRAKKTSTKKVVKKKVAPKKTTKKTTKKTAPNKATRKKASAKKKTTKKSTTPKKKTVQKKKTTRSVRKRTVTRKTVLKKSSGSSVESLYDLMVQQDAELQVFQTPDYMSQFGEDVALNLFGELEESQEETISSPEEENVSAASEVKKEAPVAISLRSSHNSRHVLDLRSDHSELVEEVEQEADFITTATETGLGAALVSSLRGDSETHGYRITGTAQIISSLSVVAWFLYIVLTIYPLLRIPALLLKQSFVFIGQSLREHVTTVKDVITLIMAGKFDKESFIHPEQAFVDVDLFPDKKQPAPKLAFAYSTNAFSSLAVFLVMALVVVMPVKGLALLDSLHEQQTEVLGASESAYSSLQLAIEDIQQFSWLTASEHFEDSRNTFEDVYDTFQDSSVLQNKLIRTLPGTKTRVETAEHLVQVGVEVAELGTQLTELLELLHSQDTNITLTRKLKLVQDSIDTIHKTEDKIAYHFSFVDIDVLPEDVQDDVLLLQTALPQVTKSLDQVDDILDFAYILLGGDRQQRYVVAFQNSDEIRPAGGFMGSLTTATLYQGKVISTETPGGGPYDWQAWLTTPTVAPEPLHLVNPVWQFQDANWFVDFSVSAEKILSFYHQLKPERVDGVIAVNSYFLPDILRITGDIYLPEYDLTLTPDNVLDSLQQQVEFDYDKEENKPKAIVGDLLDVVIGMLTERDDIQLVELLDNINTALLQRDIQMYFKDPVLQEQVNAWDWGGTVQQTDGDFVMIVKANVGGGKTDRFIVQESSLVSNVQEAGGVVNELRIKRTHNGIPGDVLYGINNVSYIQVMVPANAELISVEGDIETPPEKAFEIPPSDIPTDPDLARVFSDIAINGEVDIFDAYGKTIFGFWTQTNIGETSEVLLKYSVPIDPVLVSAESDSALVQKIDTVLQSAGLKEQYSSMAWHSLYWQRQSGDHNHSITYSLQYPENWQLEHSIRPGYTTPGSIELSGELERDMATGFLFTK
ncbi:MAG: DUF4012 domain-containing protein [Patescibacteria group bacterium]